VNRPRPTSPHLAPGPTQSSAPARPTPYRGGRTHAHRARTGAPAGLWFQGASLARSPRAMGPGRPRWTSANGRPASQLGSGTRRASRHCPYRPVEQLGANRSGIWMRADGAGDRDGRRAGSAHSSSQRVRGGQLITTQPHGEPACDLHKRSTDVAGRTVAIPGLILRSRFCGVARCRPWATSRDPTIPTNRLCRVWVG